MIRALRMIWPVLIFVAVLVVPGFSSGTMAADKAMQAQAPKWAHYHSIVDVDFVKTYAVIPKRKDVVIIDSRPKARKYDRGHIPTAISIPFRKFDKFVHMLPEDKSTLMIFYCGGVKCPLSHKSAFKAEKMGYTNIKVFSTGYPAWIKAGNLGAVSTEYVKKLIDTKAKALIVDARPARKFKKGSIPTAINIPFREFDKHVAMLPADKSTPLIYFCGGYKCTLSPKSAMKAWELGYTNVKIHPAGYPEWKKLFGSAAVSKAGGLGIQSGQEQGTISIASFQKIMETKPGDIMLVDVRDPAEFASGSFKTAVNIPIDDLEKQVDGLPTDKPVVFVCNTGALAGEAWDMVALLTKKVTAYFLEAEVSYNPDGTYAIAPVAN